MSTVSLSALLAGLALLTAPAAWSADPYPPTVTPVPAAEAQLRVPGVVRDAVRFRDGDAELMLVLSETGRYVDDDASHARLYATALVRNRLGEWQERWQIRDHVLDCPVDLVLRYTDPAFRLSDADRDGQTEVWVSYRLACRGDVSPSTLKLIGYEGTQKLALRGQTTLVYRVESGIHREPGSPPKADAALQQAPALRAYAESVWPQIVEESLDE